MRGMVHLQNVRLGFDGAACVKTIRKKPTAKPNDSDRSGRLDDCQPFVRAVQAGEVAMAGWAHGHYPGRRLPARVLPGLNSIGFWDARHEQNWATAPHRNEGIEFTYVENGRVSLDLKRNRYILKPGDVSVTRPWQLHQCGAPQVGCTRVFWFILDVGVRSTNTAQHWRWPDWILLTPSDRREFARQLNRQENPVWRADANMQRCFCRIAELVQADDYKPGVAMMALMVNAVVLLMLEQMRRGDRTACSEPLGESAEYVQAFWREITENRELLFREWTLAKMARHCGLGVTQFVHLTKRLFNLAPSHCLQRYRVEYAAGQLVQRPDDRITDIATECGFGSGQYFAQCFRRRFGCSPQVFRATRPDANGEKRGVGTMRISSTKPK